MTTQQECSRNTGQMCSDLETSRVLRICRQSTSIPAEIHANRTPRHPGHAEVRKRVQRFMRCDWLQNTALGLFSGKIRAMSAQMRLGLGGDLDDRLSDLVIVACPSDSGHVVLALTTSGIDCSCSPRMPTPMSCGWGSQGHKLQIIRAGLDRKLCNGNMPIQPSLYEIMIGFPPEWTDCDVLETLSSRKSQSGLDGR